MLNKSIRGTNSQVSHKVRSRSLLPTLNRNNLSKDCLGGLGEGPERAKKGSFSKKLYPLIRHREALTQALEGPGGRGREAKEAFSTRRIRVRTEARESSLRGLGRTEWVAECRLEEISEISRVEEEEEDCYLLRNLIELPGLPRRGHDRPTIRKKFPLDFFKG
jgi:hypothetical protein